LAKVGGVVFAVGKKRTRRRLGRRDRLGYKKKKTKRRRPEKGGNATTRYNLSEQVSRQACEKGFTKGRS